MNEPRPRMTSARPFDAASNGRAEIILGRGSFIESFPLFGYPLDQYETLFEEKLELFAAILEANRTGTPVTWSGTTRGPIKGLKMFPPTESGRLTTWIGVGGSPESVVRAAHYGLPLILAIIGGGAQRFAGYAQLYRQMLEQFAKPALPIGVHSPGHVAATDEQAKEELWPHYAGLMNRIGAERGWSPIGRAHFEREAGPDGALYVGSPETVATKIVTTMKLLGLSRFELKYANGTMPHDRLLTSIELFGTKVAPMVRERMA